MQLVIKALDSTSDDPNFVILHEWDVNESEHHHALRILARGSNAPIYVGVTPIWRQLMLFYT